MSVRAIDMIGQRVGQLVVLARAEVSDGVGAHWRCECDCGKSAIVKGTNLRSGNTISCGCRRGARPTKHGASTRGARLNEYDIWCNMRARCNCATNPNYPNYGGRGISICERWADFENFLEDMGPRPGPEFSVERRDNDRGYSPENCEWGTRTAQARNRRARRRSTHCFRGHPFSEENTYLAPGGKRKCRACRALIRAGRPRRKKLSSAARQEILRQQGGRCVVQGCVETTGLIEEHSTPFALSGRPEADQLMCAAHHKEKTRADVMHIAKAKRLRDGRTQHDRRNAHGPSLRSNRKLEGRGFDKRLSKKMSGEVVSRNG